MSEKARLHNSSVSYRSLLLSTDFKPLTSLRFSSAGDSTALGSYSAHFASNKGDSSPYSIRDKHLIGGQQCRPQMLGRIRLKGWEHRRPSGLSGKFPLRHRGFFNMFIDPHTAEQDQHLSRFQQIRNGMNNGKDYRHSRCLN